MGLSSLVRLPRVRRGLAACAVVLAAGGLVLFRAPSSSGAPATGAALPAGTNQISFSGAGAHGTLGLSHTKVPAGTTERVYVDLRVVADAAAKDDAVHAPLSMVVVLDTSGSMSGEKIDQAKDAVTRLVRDMSPNDEIALVRYSDEAETIQELARVADVREDLVTRVKNLQAGGGTAIPRGLSRGLTQLASVKSGRVRRVVLVSDGLDSTRVEAERLASDSAERGVTISSLGIGLDFDEAYMGGVARAGHGNFGFVKDAGALATFLHRELTETAATTVENATVHLDLPRGVTFVKASGATAESDKGVDLHLGSLFAGDERRVIVELDAALAAGDAADIGGSATWSTVGPSGKGVDVAFGKLALAGSNDTEAVRAGLDPAVLANATSVLASERETAATEAYARGDTTTAQRLIDTNLDQLRRVQAIAPVAAKPMLDKQIAAYDSTKTGFAAAAPTSTEGKVRAKRAFELDQKNLHSNAF